MRKPMTTADEIKHYAYPRLDLNTGVIVTRSLRGITHGGGPWTEEPQTLGAALRSGRLDTESGTVDVRITMADGPLRGTNVFLHNGLHYAQYDNRAGQYDPVTDTIDPEWIEYQRELRS